MQIKQNLYMQDLGLSIEIEGYKVVTVFTPCVDDESIYQLGVELQFFA